MTSLATPAISWVTLLKLGRVSNLPTVWTNTLAGTLVAGGSWQDRAHRHRHRGDEPLL